MDKISVVIIDDEKENIKLLEYFLSKYCPLANVMGKASSVEDGVSLLNELKPDVLFLDVKLNNKSGFEILDPIVLDTLRVIFVSAFSNYAIKKFKHNAVYFLLKPIIIDELKKAFNIAYTDISNKTDCSKNDLNNITNIESNDDSLL